MNHLLTHTNKYIQYPLGMICEDQNWRKKLTILITATTDEADLVFAFGSSISYFAVAMAYDDTLCVPLGKTNDPILPEPNRCDAVFVTPRTGSPLQLASPTLELQYATSNDFREALISGNNHTKEWQVLVDGAGGNSNTWNLNASHIILDIVGDRKTGKTYLTVFKNGKNVTIEMGSTWGLRQDVFLFFGLDAIHEERFVLSGITSEDDCSWRPAPTTAAPTSPTSYPTYMPTVVPSNPSEAPTDDPTNIPSAMPTQETDAPTTDPTNDPTAVPTEETSNPSHAPSESTLGPSTYPTVEPTGVPTDISDQPTGSPTPVPSVTVVGVDGGDPTSPPLDTLVDDGTVDEPKETIIDGVDDLYLFIGIGAVALLLIVGGLAIAYIVRVDSSYKQAKQIEQHVASSSEYEKNEAWATGIYGD